VRGAGRGADIVEELAQSGELERTLEEKLGTDTAALAKSGCRRRLTARVREDASRRRPEAATESRRGLRDPSDP
jgi:hypothetical protein